MTQRIAESGSNVDNDPLCVIVTGAGGFVCSHFVEALLNAGYKVIAIDRAFDLGWIDQFSKYADRLEVWEGDSVKLPDIDAFALIHGAALTSQNALSNAEYIQANLDPFLTVMEWSAQHVDTRLVFISSSGVYAKQSHDLLAHANAKISLMPKMESDYPNPDSLYGSIKSFIEHVVMTSEFPHAQNWIVIRLGSIYGPYEIPRSSRQHTSAVGTMIRSALDSKTVLDDGKLATDWTFAPDLGRAVVELLRMPAPLPSDGRSTIYNLTSGLSYSTHDIATALIKCIPNVQISTPVANLPVSTRPPLSNQKFTADTGFNAWTSIEDGLNQTIQWMQVQLATQAQVMS